MTPALGRRGAVLAALALLYGAQGIPFGFAAEYLPVLLRSQGMSRTHIAALFWLQLPWQLKPLWAAAADHPRVRPHARALLLALQLGLAVTMAAYALFEGPEALGPWFALTALAALLAATQDILVDAFAVRSLSRDDRGYGNSAQIAGYRVGIIVGGGGMLVLSAALGPAVTLLCCAGLIALAGVGAFALRDEGAPSPGPVGPYRVDARVPAEAEGTPGPRGLWAMLGHVFGRGTWRVAALAMTFKLGAHAASGLIKPLLVDAGWSHASIGATVVTFGTGAAVLGALGGGALHRSLGERRALALAAGLQAATIVPMVAVAALGAPHALTAAVIALEHGASGLATTVLFAALMTATWRDRAALHYTVLTSLNALAIGLGGLLGAVVGDLAGNRAAFGVAAVAAAAPLFLLPGWEVAVARSAREPKEGDAERAAGV